ncbi:MAG: helix-turn-helix transcriptional regulator [Chloroflexi bacterium]|nr:helix-turn-helix transcriptional regulator [Chloroflexota bacterium]
MPDVALVFRTLKGVDNLGQVIGLREVQPSLGFVLYIRPTDDLGCICELAGNKGVAFMGIEAHASDWLFAVSMVRRGFVIVSPELTVHLGQCKIPDLALTRPPGLTLDPREKAVVEFLCIGLKEYEMADIMHCSVRTVQGYIARAREKLSAKDRTHAVALAMEGRLIREPSLISRNGPFPGFS